MHCALISALEAKPIPMDTLPATLPEVRICLNKPMAIQKGDTIEYDVQRHQPMVAESLGQLLGRMPGFQVDAYGNIHYNGRQISRIKVDGDDLSAGDYRHLTRIIKAGMLNKIQVLQHDQPNRLLKDMVTGDGLAINLEIRSGQGTSPHGQVTAGATQGKKRGVMEMAGLDKRLRQLMMLKYLPFANPDDISQPPSGLVETDNEHEKAYQSWQTNPESFGMPSVGPPQHLQYATNVGRWTASYRTDTFTRVRHTLHVGQNQVQHAETQQRQWWWDGAGINNVMYGISGLYKKRQALGRIEVERDPGKAHTERWLIQLEASSTENTHQEQEMQHGWRDIDLKQQRQQRMVDISRTSTTRKASGMVLLHQQKISHDNHNAEAFVDDDQSIWLANHRGWMGYDQWTFMLQQSRMRMQAGIRNAFHHIRAGSDHSTAALHVLKSYPFFQLQQRIHKKLTQELRFAAGAIRLQQREDAAAWMSTGKVGWMAEWKPRPTRGLRFGADIGRLLEDPSAWHPGRVLHTNGQMDAGTPSLMMNESTSLYAGWSSMNLYRGLVWQLNTQFNVNRGERGMELVQRLQTDSLQSYVLGIRKTFRMQGSADQYIHPLKLRTALGFDYSHAIASQRVQGMLLPTRFIQMNIRVQVQTQWKGRYNMTWITHWNAMRFKLMRLTDFGNVFGQHEFHLMVKPSKHGWLELGFRRYGNGVRNPLHLLDLKAYQPMGKQVDVAVRLNNILNSRVMEQCQQAISGTEFRSVFLPGRQFTAEISFRF